MQSRLFWSTIRPEIRSRAEMDAQDDREDRQGASGNRHSGIAQYSRSALVPNGFLSARQPQADRHQFQPLPGSAISAYRPVARASSFRDFLLSASTARNAN